MSRILFASSEATPLIKTGGLADISGSLPAALKDLRQSIRLILPAYPQALERIGKTKSITQMHIGHHSVTVHEGKMPDSGVPVWLVESAEYFTRDGGPYLNAEGRDWADNAQRFTLFARVIVELAMGRAGLKWVLRWMAG